MEERFLSYVTPIDFNPDSTCLEQSFNKVHNLFTNFYQKLKVYSVNESIKTLPSSTSAGLPFAPGIKKGEVKNHLVRLANAQWRRISRGDSLLVAPCRAGVRRQLREKGKNKPRLVWAYPGYINVLENQFSGPFLKKDKPSFLGWSVNWMDQGKSLFRIISARGWNSVAQIDFSSFDSTVSARLIRMAFKIIEDCLDLSDNQRRMLGQLEAYFIHTPLVMYDSIRRKHRGIPSGSAMTQLVGSIVNMIACYYCSFKNGRYQIIDRRSCFLGDDSLVYFNEGMAKVDFEELFLSHFSDLGLNVSPEKTNYTINFDGSSSQAPIKFLGREIVRGRYYYKIDRDKLSAQVMWPENPDRTKYDTATRLIGLVWAYGFYPHYYAWFKKLFSSLRIKDKTRLFPKVETLRFVTHFVRQDVDLTSFPDFEKVETSYFGPVLGRKEWKFSTRPPALLGYTARTC
jgi:hypothetical protein